VEESLKNIIYNLPSKPGVYRFYGEANFLLYIGKAKNLKNRVSSYFQESKPRTQRIMLMVSQIIKIEYTVVENEKEAIILEANLIHSLQPKYNILLKDDKSYLYVRLTNDPIPGYFLTRRKFDPKSLYFGPYTQKYSLTDVMRTLRTIFPYCQERYPSYKVCSYYSIKQCEGICARLESKEEYNLKIQQIRNVLEGRTELAEEWLKNKITEAIEQDNYELAALWRDRLTTLKNTIGEQKIILPSPQNIDLITLVVKVDPEGLAIGSVFLQRIREGKVINVSNFILSGVDEITEDVNSNIAKNQLDPDELGKEFLRRFLNSYNLYQDKSEVFAEIFYTDDF
jgi:excinuclease ABC subunit C